jgi:hypothetical protein
VTAPAPHGNPGSVLAVMAHPDDAEMWAGGTLAHHARHAAVTIAIPRPEPARLAEAETGAAILRRNAGDVRAFAYAWYRISHAADPGRGFHASPSVGGLTARGHDLPQRRPRRGG